MQSLDCIISFLISLYLSEQTEDSQTLEVPLSIIEFPYVWR